MDEKEKLSELKEQKETLEDFIKVNEYLNQLNAFPGYSEKIEQFINKTINKYRLKPEVANFYIGNGGTNRVVYSQFNTLIAIKDMITQFALVKFGEEFLRR